MAGETVITVVGNLTADPELRYTGQGKPVANMTIASTPRNFDRQTSEWKDGEALFLRCSVWNEFAEHVAGSLTKGTRVIAQGRLKQKSYETKEGEKRTSIELEIDEIGPSLRYATAQVTRAAGNGQGGQQQAVQGGQQYGAQQGPPQGAPQQAYQGPPQQGYPAPQQGQPAYPPQGPPQQAVVPPQQPQQGPPQQQYAAPPQQYGNPAAQEPWTTPGAGYGDDTPF